MEYITMSEDYRYVTFNGFSFDKIGVYESPPNTTPTPPSKTTTETMVYLKQEPIDQQSPVLNTEVKTAFATASIFAFLASLLQIGRLRFGIGFVKLFQIIEIMSKFVFIPIWYKDLLLDVMYGLS